MILGYATPQSFLYAALVAASSKNVLGSPVLTVAMLVRSSMRLGVWYSSTAGCPVKTRRAWSMYDQAAKVVSCPLSAHTTSLFFMRSRIAPGSLKVEILTLLA